MRANIEVFQMLLSEPPKSPGNEWEGGGDPYPPSPACEEQGRWRGVPWSCPGEVAGLGLGPPSPEHFVNTTEEFRTRGSRPSQWAPALKKRGLCKAGLSFPLTPSSPVTAHGALAKCLRAWS